MVKNAKLEEAGNLLDALETSRAQIAAAKSECEALKSGNAQLQKDYEVSQAPS